MNYLYYLYDEINNKLNSNTISNKTIIHVYNSNYIAGLGDFLRGTIYLAQNAKYFNINFKIIISDHIIIKYLNNETEILPENIKINTIYHEVCEANNNIFYSLIKNFIDSDEENLYIHTNAFYSKNQVTCDIKDYINSIFRFKPQYYDNVKELFNLNKYNVLHIRCPDEDFNTNFQNENLLLKIKRLHLSNNTFIMSNNYELKKKLNNIFRFHFIDNRAFHIAYLKNDADLESTIIDYIILSQSSNTYCLTPFWWGSGFSKECSVLNNVPYNFEIF